MSTISATWLAPRKARPRSGVALVLVLACLVIISILILAFLSGARTELTASKAYANGSNVNLLSESAVNYMIGTIKTATAGQDASGNKLAWASQPGMIRTFGTDGNLNTAYKLYSSDKLTATSYGKSEIDAELRDLANWKTDTAIYTDLNEPLDGAYPILDPGAATLGVKGFAVDASKANPSATQAIPMPVRWLYVLQDGGLAPAAGTGKNATITGASSTNPIVGRMAFWTDDETCKVNVNTAAGGPWNNENASVRLSSLNYTGAAFGAFWDTPRANTDQDRYLAASQPAVNEFQRYPGHPATTYLSAVFPSATRPDLTTLIPRINGGGSDGGTTIATTAVTPDADRLYASVDELTYQPDRTVNALPTGDDLKKSRFFLTTRSRSPEVNLFNLPRLSMWPVHTNPASRTAYDKLIALDNTLGGQEYFFSRSDPNSESADLGGRNRALLTYLRTLTTQAVPGFSGTSGILGKYPADKDQILTELVDYIHSINPADTSNGAVKFAVTTAPSVRYGQIVPLFDADTSARGFGRFPTVSKVALLFWGVADAKNKILNSNNPAILAAPGKIKIKCAILPEMFVPAQGWSKNSPTYSMTIEGASSLTWQDGTNMNFSSPMVFSTALDTGAKHSRLWGGRQGFRSLMIHSSGQVNFSSKQYSPDFPVGGTFDFPEANLTIKLKDYSGGTTYQTINVKIPAGRFPVPELAPLVPDGATSPTPDFRDPNQRFKNGTGNLRTSWITSKDTVRSVECVSGDFRLIAAQKVVPDTSYAKHPLYDEQSQRFAHSLIEAKQYPFYGATLSGYVTGAQYVPLTTPTPTPTTYNDLAYGPPTALGQPQANGGGLVTIVTSMDNPSRTGVMVGGAGAIPGDWDNGVASAIDGPYINRPDDGNIYGLSTNRIPYFEDDEQIVDAGPTFFTPNRQIASSGMFGSLPTGVKANKPWQTLLFRPGPASHPGLAGARDHLLLDLFNMPVVEPYAISENLSTDGKVNMNYQILPFTYIQRSTAVQAVLRSEWMLAINNTQGNSYKEVYGPGVTNPGLGGNMRYQIDLEETLKGFDNRFTVGDIFRSASEICDLWLVPAGLGASYSSMPTFWDNYLLTGDNSRERPYTNIYPRLTTKSNTYMVHYRVQTLQKIKNSTATQWVEGKDQVTGELRGATVVERYLDTNAAGLPDFAAAGAPSIDPYYKFRFISTKQFKP